MKENIYFININTGIFPLYKYTSFINKVYLSISIVDIPHNPKQPKTKNNKDIIHPTVLEFLIFLVCNLIHIYSINKRAEYSTILLKYV